MFFSCLVSVPVDGKWGVWGKWTTCSKTCGGGYMSRSRTCNNPAPQNGGRPCQGPSSERTSCNDQKCPGRRCIDLIVIVCAAVSHSACEVGVKGGEVSNFQNLGEFYEHTSCSIKDGHNLAGEGGGGRSGGFWFCHRLSKPILGSAGFYCLSLFSPYLAVILLQSPLGQMDHLWTRLAGKVRESFPQGTMGREIGDTPFSPFPRP